MRRVATLLLLLGGLAVAPGRAADPAPVGAIAYFSEACPEGWMAYDAANGRALVPSPLEGLGRPVGEALAEGAEATHGHKAYATFRLSGTTVAWRSAYGSRTTAADRPFTEISGRGSADVQPSGLPLAKMNVCQKVEAPAGAAPAGMLFFFNDSSCPDGWSAFREANGRVLTGAMPAESVGPFGSQPLAVDEDRRHDHTLGGTVDYFPWTFTIWARCLNCNWQYALAKIYRFNGKTEESSSGLPYLQLQACSKDAPVGPQISKISHGADFQARALAVGQHASIFGEGMGPAEGVGAALDADGEVLRERAGVQVMVDEVAAPLFFVREDQINFQVPYEVADRSTVQVAVVRDGVRGPNVAMALQAAAPALFAWGDDPSRAIAVYADGTLNGEDNPAAPGQPLIFFATGEGQTAPPGRTGVPAEAPYPAPLGDVELWIGGEQATLDYAGAAPGFVGLMQINARMTQASGKASVVLKVGGVETAVETSIFAQ
ncbi:MAG: hypothetical protein GC160_29060 [Acidobacteria bacterium]|nr:hypothetical protein [Acidobacteriota bacterium]